MQHSGAGFVNTFVLVDNTYRMKWSFVVVLSYAGSVSLPAFCPVSVGCCFPGGGAVCACGWLLTTSLYRGQECVELLLHSPLRLCGMVLVYCTRTALPFTFTSITSRKFSFLFTVFTYAQNFD
jgi:hypothetical protein